MSQKQNTTILRERVGIVRRVNVIVSDLLYFLQQLEFNEAHPLYLKTAKRKELREEAHASIKCCRASLANMKAEGSPFAAPLEEQLDALEREVEKLEA